MNIEELLNYSDTKNASDIHISIGSSPNIRVNGDIIKLNSKPVDEEDIEKMMHYLMDEQQFKRFNENKELDFSLQMPSKVRYRINIFRTLNGASIALRRIPCQIQTIESLDLPPVIKSIATLNSGLVLITGSTGSGKSTTLASIVDYINRNYAKHIITIEDPIEFIHSSAKSILNQREINTHTNSFKTALRSALREDPDVILVGELRDYETISLALTAAETGHLVLATLHTGSAAKSIDRIIDVFPEHDKSIARTMLAGSLKLICTQLLVKKADNSGRLALTEILINNSAIKNLIKDNKIQQIFSTMQVNSKIGMQTMQVAAENAFNRKLIDQREFHQVIASIKDMDDSDAKNISHNLTGQGVATREQF